MLPIGDILYYNYIKLLLHKIQGVAYRQHPVFYMIINFVILKLPPFRVTSASVA